MKERIPIHKLGFASKSVHAGAHPDNTTGAISPPIYQTSTYAQSSPGRHAGYEYTRSHNPTRDRLEECLASLENASHAVATSTGMGAAVLMMHLVPTGSKILCGNDVYGGTYRMFTQVFGKTHDFRFIDTSDEKTTFQTIQDFKPRLVWLESPTNPLLKITDIQNICSMAKDHGAKVLVDNTFMSPCFQNPLDLGADFVLHSLTKYIGGHSDVLGGCIATNDRGDYDRLWYLQNSIGVSLSPFDSWLLLRGIRTLALRMRAHEAGALKVASFLENHELVERVIYPGLPSHRQHDLAKKQMHGFGGMVSFNLKGSPPQTTALLENLSLFLLAESLGSVESLANHPATMTHASIPKDVRESIGITDNLVRLSVGIEDADDLTSDLHQALLAASRA